MDTQKGIPRMRGRLRPLLVVLAGAVGLAVAAGGPLADAALACDRVASPSGSDANPGTTARPYVSAQKLAGSLTPGEVGCLRGGAYGDVIVSRSGTARAPITITSFPGERATIMGRVWITDSANFVTMASLDLDGRNAPGLPTPVVNGDDVTFMDNEVTNRDNASCFDLGATTYGRAYRTVIQRNRIHGCGRFPPTNFDHGIYVEHATGARIVDNLIWDNADRGVQLYPDAQATYVAGNVIDGNGEGVLIGGGSEDYGSQASNDNVIELNSITYSTQRNNVEAHWGSGLVGRRNVVRQNCIFGGAADSAGHGLGPQNGFVAVNNVLADPLYVNRAAKDFRLRAGSPCLDLAARNAPQEPDPPHASRRAGVLLQAGTRLQPGRRANLVGRVLGQQRPTRVAIQVRVGSRWRRVIKVRTGADGSFGSRPLLRRRGRAGSSRAGRRLSLQRVRLSRGVRELRLRATVFGGASSPTVAIRIRR